MWRFQCACLLAKVDVRVDFQCRVIFTRVIFTRVKFPLANKNDRGNV